MYLDATDKKYIKNVSKIVLWVQAIGGIFVLGSIILLFSFIFKMFKTTDQHFDRKRSEFQQSRNEYIDRFDSRFENGKNELLNHSPK